MCNVVTLRWISFCKWEREIVHRVSMQSNHDIVSWFGWLRACLVGERTGHDGHCRHDNARQTLVDRWQFTYKKHATLYIFALHCYVLNSNMYVFFVAFQIVFVDDEDKLICSRDAIISHLSFDMPSNESVKISSTFNFLIIYRLNSSSRWRWKSSAK